MKLKGCVVALIFLQTWLTPVFAAACHAESGQYVIPLLELYTSEGCSSCPPADRWLSSLQSRQGEVNALAFHVDYWDGLGWKDRFAQEAFSDKQRTQASQTGSNVVYTPQFTLNGYDFRGWSDSRLDRLLQKINMQPAQLTLALQQLNEDNGQIAFRTTVTTPQQHLPVQLWLAVYQHGLHTQVKAGENNGRVLNHDFVVLQHMGPYSLDQLNILRHLVPDQSLLAHANGVVLYARHALNGEVLQSLQLPVCRPGH
ncbi:MAG TPA: DUF1223 domain-containing protein [Methylophilus sp.]|jgi:hypothetical protein|nr:DUF1223 domain-containing protein [Methylophilus sp.]